MIKRLELHIQMNVFCNKSGVNQRSLIPFEKLGVNCQLIPDLMLGP